MNNDFYNTQIPRYRSYQLLTDTIRSYNQNVRLNNQHMIEYNRNMHDLIVLLREHIRPQNIRRPTREPPPTATPIRRPFGLSRHMFSDIVRNYNPDVYTTRPTIVNEDANNERPYNLSRINSNTSRITRPRSRSLGEFMTNNTNNMVSSDSDSDQDRNSSNMALDPSANVTTRTFTTIPNSTLSTSFHNASRNSISTIYHLLRRDFDEIMGFNNFVETTDENAGLTDEEKEMGLLDISFNVDIHSSIDTQCPISLDDFQENENITQVVECGHIFKTQPIMTWFERHTKCPKCRCELRANSDSPGSLDVSFNVVTPLQNMNDDDIEREIDELTRRVTRSMIEDINRNVEITIDPSIFSSGVSPNNIRQRYSSQRNNIRNTNTSNNDTSSDSDD